MRRRAITGSREALNGYQKGRCFYCGRDIEAGQADVDHFLPHAMLPFGVAANIDGIWNLVLACANCNLARTVLNETVLARRGPVGARHRTGDNPDRARQLRPAALVRRAAAERRAGRSRLHPDQGVTRGPDCGGERPRTQVLRGRRRDRPAR